ncbi:hypothetical protein pb186bvf_018935 [Paramecium bursaria]
MLEQQVLFQFNSNSLDQEGPFKIEQLNKHSLFKAVLIFQSISLMTAKNLIKKHDIKYFFIFIKIQQLNRLYLWLRHVSNQRHKLMNALVCQIRQIVTVKKDVNGDSLQFPIQHLNLPYNKQLKVCTKYIFLQFDQSIIIGTCQTRQLLLQFKCQLFVKFNEYSLAVVNYRMCTCQQQLYHFCRVLSICQNHKRCLLSQFLTQCTSDGIRCITPTACSTYSSQELCTKNMASSGARSSNRNNDNGGICRDTKFSEAPRSFKTQQQCNNWIAGCLTNGVGQLICNFPQQRLIYIFQFEIYNGIFLIKSCFLNNPKYLIAQLVFVICQIIQTSNFIIIKAYLNRINFQQITI